MKPQRIRNFEIILGLSGMGIWILRWPLLQLLAWGRMLIMYSADHGIREGVSRTFSGEYPCALCHLARAAAETEASILSSPFAMSVVAAVLFTAAAGSFLTRNLFQTVRNGK